MSPQLHEAAQAKLDRIAQFLYGQWFEAYYTRELVEARVYDSARSAVLRCKKDVQYEYLGLKDSWL
jgi:hypothetical protein